MYKIKNITFKNHPILGNLHIDFCGLDGNAADTVIIAGENGTGKSTVIDAIYQALCFASTNEVSMLIDLDGEDVLVEYYWREENGLRNIWIKDNKQSNMYQRAIQVKDHFKFRAIFSDVDINFKGGNIQAVTSTELDKATTNQKSSPNLPTQIKQLIVDIQSSDDADTAMSFRTVAQGTKEFKDIISGSRMLRFTEAFNRMFDGLTYSRVENVDNKKSIIFQKNGKMIEIDSLSSGEKQIVYRGCFLLRDINALNGAFVFVDEPEISLHPKWQKKILNYYKGIFTDSNGQQTSQLFVVTHSPFIIHNSERKNDKVIVLQRDESGLISVLDKPEYYFCDSTLPIRDAFDVNDFDADIEKSVVYLEGRTDEKYFKKAIEVFGYTDFRFEFQWVGHLLKSGQEEFTGANSLNQALNFMRGRKPERPQIFLYDCDTNKQELDEGNIIVMTIPKYERDNAMNIGIENALELEGINIEEFYSYHTNPGKAYGQETTVKQFEKMKLCDYICGLDIIKQKKILSNLKLVIDRIAEKGKGI